MEPEAVPFDDREVQVGWRAEEENPRVAEANLEEEVLEWQTGSRATYDNKLDEALRLLRPADFGAPVVAGRYNRANWELKPDPVPGFSQRRMLVLRRDKRPSQAIEDIVRNSHNWTMDCAFYVQVIHLYALSQVNPTLFDSLWGRPNSRNEWENKEFRLRYHWSSGAGAKYYFRRFDPAHPDQITSKSLPWRFNYRGRWHVASSRWSTATILAAMPRGSRVMWTNNRRQLALLSDTKTPSRLVMISTAPLDSGTWEILTGKQVALLLATVELRRPLEPIIRDLGNASQDVVNHADEHVFVAEAVSFRRLRPEPAAHETVFEAGLAEREGAEEGSDASGIGKLLWSRFPAGIHVAVYDPDESEFKHRADDWAKREEAIGPKGRTIKADQLVAGRALPDTLGLVRTIVELGTALKDATNKIPEDERPTVAAGTGPFLVRTLALFAHGWGTTLAIGKGLTSGTVADVVRRIAPHVTVDVRIVLYGCSVCAEPNEPGWMATTMGPGGNDLLCAMVRDALVNEGKTSATVWGTYPSRAHHTELESAHVLRRRFPSPWRQGRGWPSLCRPVRVRP